MLRSESRTDPALEEAALTGLRAYQQAPRPAPPPAPPCVATVGRARLLDIGGTGRPVVFVPSLINGSQILDILPELSMLRWLSENGVRPLLIDWGTPTPAERDLSIAGHVESMLLPMLRNMGSDVALAGYCLGGTMAIAAAASAPVHALVLIAAPWRFAGFGQEARPALQALWKNARPTADAIGLLPLEVLQAGFWQLDPRRTIAKFAAFGHAGRAGDEARRFVAIEDWANGGPPLTLAAARELIEDLFGNDTTGTGRWVIDGRAVDPARLDCPVLNVISTTDRIVPAASAAEAGTPLRLEQGHVGMVVGGRARDALWAPLARWLADPR